MLRVLGVCIAALLLLAGKAEAGNSDDVVAGSDVALTGGAVVANVQTGGAMWFNPAGVARLDSSSVDLTGAVLSYSIVNAPGLLSIDSGESSEGDFSSTQAIPRALTFVAAPRPALRWGIGFFFSRSRSRFLQDSVSTADGAAEPAQFFGTADETKSLYHLSSALAWKKSEKFLLGGGFDIVIATSRLTEIVSGAWDDGAGGTFGRSFNQALSGGGLQLKLGIQWAPVREFRFGWMVATPSYLVYLNNETTEIQEVAPPNGSPQFQGQQIDDLSGTWSGVERGLTRLGGAWLQHWGWLELDLVVGFPLRTSVFDIDWRATADVRLGGVFKVTEKLKLGAGFQTDFTPERSADNFGDLKVNFYSFTIGVDFANKERPPERGEDGFYLAFAVAFKYSHGRGDVVGARFPSSFPALPSQPDVLNVVSVTSNEFGVNVAVKAAF
jgi:long-subunit fatty acid transport protein